jgi:uncharacterized membrane protein YoaK (UPF0700 family)
MADLIGFFTLGNIFTAHVTGNLVVATAALVSHAPVKFAQVLAIPVFMLALVIVWTVARTSGRKSLGLVRLLLLIQFILLAAVLVVTVVSRASTQPHGSMAVFAAMLAVAAMACQYAVFRLAMPNVVSTAVMTGNLTNTVLLSMDVLTMGGEQRAIESSRLARSARLLLGFLFGCAIAGVAVSRLADWAWAIPVALAGLAMLLVPLNKNEHSRIEGS